MVALYFIVVILISLGTSEEITDFSELSFEVGINDGISATSSDMGYNFEFQEEGGIVLDGNGYFSASENSFIETDQEGTIINAELTATKETGWTFDNNRYTVPEGGKLIYENGKVKIEIPQNSEMSIEKEGLEYTLQNTLDEQVEITEDLITGKDFQVDNLRCSGISGESCSIQPLSENTYLIKEGGKITNSKITISAIQGDLELTEGGETPLFTQMETNQAWISQDSSEIWGKAGGLGQMSYVDSQGITTTLQDGAQGYSSQNAIELDTSQGGLAKLFDLDAQIIESNGEIVNIKTDVSNIPLTNIKITTDQQTFFYNEGGGEYKGFYALGDISQGGVSIAYMGVAEIPLSDLEDLEDFNYIGVIGVGAEF